VKGICIRNPEETEPTGVAYFIDKPTVTGQKINWFIQMRRQSRTCYPTSTSHITQTDYLKWSASYIWLYRQRVNQLALNHHITGRFTSDTRQLYTHSKCYGTVISHNKSQITCTRVMALLSHRFSAVPGKLKYRKFCWSAIGKHMHRWCNKNTSICSKLRRGSNYTQTHTHTSWTPNILLWLLKNL